MKSLILSSALLALLLCSCQQKPTPDNSTQADTAAQQTAQPVPSAAQSPSAPEHVVTQSQQTINPHSAPLGVAITPEMAYEGVNNYCRSNYDWSPADRNPEMMYVAMGDETKTEYKVIFRSYTGSFVYFYVNKASGATRMVNYVPGPEIKEDAGTINLKDYLKKK